MKRIISFFLILIMLAAALPDAVLASNKSFATNLNVVKSADTWNDKVDGSGQDYATVKVEYRLRGEGIRGIQGAWIAVDLTELLWVDPTTDGRSVRVDINNGTLAKGASPVKCDKLRMYTLKESLEDADGEVDEWTSGAFSFTSAALSADGKTLFIGLQPMQNGAVSYADYTTVMTLTFAVLGGGDGASVSAGAVRFVNTSERDRLNQSFIVAMSDGSDGYYYGDKSEADTLSAPTVTGDAFAADDGDEGERETVPPTQDEDGTEQGGSSSNEDNTPPEKEWKNPFVDVPRDADYIDAVEFVYENGIQDLIFLNNMTIAGTDTAAAQLLSLMG